MTIGSLFSGIGGLELGLERAGLGPVAWQAEIDPFAREILRAHWPNVKQYRDVREVKRGRADTPRVLCGGFPCQPFSVAGSGLGRADPRHLWPECARILGDLDPEWCVWENVPPLRTRGLCGVLGDLAALGFDAEWFDLRASDVGAPHRRERLFVVGHRDGGRLDRFRAGLVRAMAERGIGTDVADGERRKLQRRGEPGDVAREAGEARDESEGRDPGLASAGGRSKALADGNGDGRERERERETRLHDQGALGDRAERRDPHVGGRFPPRPFDREGWGGWIADGLPEPVIRGGAHGVSDRLDRLAALGNAVVPGVAEMIGRAIVASELPT